jgi:galactokinase
MDQVTSAAATQDHALLLDCRNESLEQVALNDPAIAILIADTRVRHTLTDGQYARRREECQQALKELGASSFREISSEDIEWASGQLDAIALKRVRHVVSEISRTLAAAEAMRSHDWDALGQLMYESHASLRDDFCVSCPELDTLVAGAAAIGPAGGVYGSRMTGGGFGGCTVSLVAASEAPSIALRLQAKYKQQTEIEPTLFVTRPAAGSFLATTPTGDSARRSETG